MKYTPQMLGGKIVLVILLSDHFFIRGEKIDIVRFGRANVGGRR
jgi:hypothetical protein